VRLAKSFSAIFTESPHKKGYNLTIGTSDKGTPLGSVVFKSKKRRRALLVIGGVKGLEFALANDDTLKSEDVALTFDHYVNVCPDQGSRTISELEELVIPRKYQERAPKCFHVNGNVPPNLCFLVTKQFYRHYSFCLQHGSLLLSVQA
ncbi:hypothetical protein GE061_018417, partial [Apolygus lucorum]